MGDKRRFIIMAKWIRNQFPVQKFKNVADIAAGTGELSYELRAHGYNCICFDKRKKRIKNRLIHIRKNIKDLHFKEGEFDVAVGLHPDGATEAVIRLAYEAKAPFAIVPCCVMPEKELKMNEIEWRNHLKVLAMKRGFSVYTTRLDMRGRNTIIKGWLS
jgi:hypothetical protein